MRSTRKILVSFVCLLAACAGGVVEDDGTATADESLSGWSSPYKYFYASAVPANHQGGPLALRRANAVPGGLNGSTYGYAILPYLTTASAKTQAALDSLLAVPYAGNENRVLALVAIADDPSAKQQPASKIYEIYLPSQSVAVSDVQQRYTAFQRSAKLRLVNEGDFPAGTTAFDYSGTVDPAVAQAAVNAGAFFSASGAVNCSAFLWWLTCKTPSSLKVSAHFTRAD